MEFHFPHCALIHRSAWNKNSANFAFWGFSEVSLQALVVGVFIGVLWVLGRIFGRR
jgi:hypothetical protein